MRAIIVLSILLLGLSNAAREPEYSAFFAGHFEAAGYSVSPLTEIESSIGRGDRLAVAAPQPHVLAVEILRAPNAAAPVTLASADPYTGSIGGSEADNDGARPTETSLDDLCQALYRSAQDNDLPIPFFANLIWQESRLHADDVSRKGAMGIAQFMPQTAAETGLDDPFDPLQAIPASARLLQKLRMQFGNLGFVAAAYNAGAHRVIDWLEHRSSLPRETRNYVVRITGLSVDTWRSMPVDNDALTFVRHLPCRSLPAFANVEQEQSEQAQIDAAKAAQTTPDEPSADDPATEHAAANDAAGNVAARKQETRHNRHETRASHERHPAKYEAAHAPHAARDKGRSV
jgi:Transglycosylase SLT domain